MPSNQINPFNYNIDNFDSGFLGPISDTNFRNWVFSHNLPVVNPVVGGVISNAFGDRGTEYDVSQSNPHVTDVPNLTDVANTPSLFNNMTTPRQDNLSRNIPGVNPEVASLGITTQDLGVDAATLLNSIPANVDLPSLEDVATIAGPLNNFTNPTQDNLAKNPSAAEMGLWHPEMISIIQQAGNSLNTSYGVPSTLKIGYAGNVESWVSAGGYTTTTFEIRDAGYFTQDNKYGPSEIVEYSIDGDNLIDGTTGFKQYNDQVQGDFRDQLFSRTLGVGVVPFSQVSSGINYKPDGTNPSELDLIARKRRGVELANRLKLNFLDDTVGAINTSPFGLLAGGSLINKNYTITVPKSGVGKAAEFVASLAGFNLPVSIIPDDAFSQGANTNGTSVDIPNALLDYTGAGQKSLLFDALYINKYGPTLGDAYTTPSTSEVKKNLAGAGQPPNTANYLSEPPQPKTEPRDKSTISDINDKVSGLFKNTQAPTIPTDDFSMLDPTQLNKTFNFDTLPNKLTDTWDVKGPSLLSTDSKGSFLPDRGAIGTAMPQEMLPDTNLPLDNGMYWGTRTNQFKKGILKFTQDLVNDSTNKSDAAGRYIGVINNDTNFNNEGKHKEYSNGNTTLTDDGEAYCRSWSVRRPYNTYDDLIRSDRNWWRTTKGSDVKGVPSDISSLMVMGAEGADSVGMPKIAWEKDGRIEKTIMAARDSVLKNGSQLEFGNLFGSDLEALARFQAVGDLDGFGKQVIPYMFSIENLAWKDAPQSAYLPVCEKGPNGGRIMWFPPYNLDFSDNTSVSWDATNIIGRGEPIYTYNHTERSGSLSFSIVVDHPAVLNDIRDKFKKETLDKFSVDTKLYSFFGGCSGLEAIFKDYLPQSSSLPQVPTETGIVPETMKPKAPVQPPSNDLKIYFENTRTNAVTNGTDYTSPNGVGRKVDLSNYEVTVASIAGNWDSTPLCCPDLTCGLNFGLQAKLEELAKFLVTEDGKNYKITIIGSTSAALPSAGFNTQLAQDRANNTATYLRKLIIEAETAAGGPPKLSGTEEYYPKDEDMSVTLLTGSNKKSNTDRWSVEAKGKENPPINKCQSVNQVENGQPCLDLQGNPTCCDGNPCGDTEAGQANNKEAKKDRFASITLTVNPAEQAKIIKKINDKNKEASDKKALEQKKIEDLVSNLAKNYVGECDYFSKLKKTDSFIYETLTEKLDNFHPAFHAMTPEGFNSRLTFLQQCTRQGPQLIDPSQPQNMVFGRPPVCVLRIGDFYHTKIIIDSVNFSFDPLQWDLNPEGIGVQPMITKVDIGFKFIGGSSLGGPIKQLQNAVSFNFFANTGVYNTARRVENYLAERSSFLQGEVIYGAFITPEQADQEYGAIVDDIKGKTAASINTDLATPAKNDTATQEKITEQAGENLVDNTVPTPTTPPATVPPTNTTVKGFIVINEDGSVTITEINTSVKKDVSFEVSYQVINKTKEPILINGITIDCETINFSPDPILPSNKPGFANYKTRVSQMSGFYQKSMSVSLTTDLEANTQKTIQVKTTLKPE